MAQRKSGYERKDNDYYPTPTWVTEALLPFIPKRIRRIWEPAAGCGAMSEVLRANFYGVLATDINEFSPLAIKALDFLEASSSDWAEAIVTNPPYNRAAEFCRKSVDIMMQRNGFVALLLAENFDCARGRADLFGECPFFAAKVILTKRIKWFDGEGSPSSNHAWFLWDSKVVGIDPKVCYVY
jgi:hypothetical protein